MATADSGYASAGFDRARAHFPPPLACARGCGRADGSRVEGRAGGRGAPAVRGGAEGAEIFGPEDGGQADGTGDIHSALYFPTRLTLY